MVFYVCRRRTESIQNPGRPVRSLLLCFLYGPQPFPLWHERRRTESDQIPEVCQPSVYSWLSDHLSVPHSPSGPGWLCHLRFFRGTDVARNLLSGRHLSERRRHLYVRHVRSGRRRRMFCRSRSGRDHLPVHRKNEPGNLHCHSLSSVPAGSDVSFKTSETSLKMGISSISRKV